MSAAVAADIYMLFIPTYSKGEGRALCARIRGRGFQISGIHKYRYSQKLSAKPVPIDLARREETIRISHAPDPSTDAKLGILRDSRRVVPSHRSSSFESSGKEGAHTTSQSMSEGRTKEQGETSRRLRSTLAKEEERDAYDPARAPTQLADTHASLSSSFVRPSLADWLVVCAPSFPLDSKLELR
ncbi:hypothetical protein DdX_08309 [Ditylenchus destructor]|uniref:Uncharacterized protein n=1 Tax=Ditylenchus destructor TaxID=166010 RepID=A0AAD4R7N3_9BILA|nr:hypothetical protein DdX_08309 [Ditylenchus destructor]